MQKRALAPLVLGSSINSDGCDGASLKPFISKVILTILQQTSRMAQWGYTIRVLFVEISRAFQKLVI